MQAALDPAAHRILGLNEVGHESGNDAFCEGRDLPWLQDTADAGVWQEWGVVYRDVVILDADGEAVEVYNLTENRWGLSGRLSGALTTCISPRHCGAHLALSKQALRRLGAPGLDPQSVVQQGIADLDVLPTGPLRQRGAEALARQAQPRRRRLVARPPARAGLGGCGDTAPRLRRPPRPRGGPLCARGSALRARR